MRILVTGAQGFTGRHFVSWAQAQGHEIFGLDVDITDRNAVARGVQEVAPEGVLHLAAIAFVAHANDKDFYSVNVVGTTNVLAALAHLPRVPRRVVLASSANVYGNALHSPIDEAQSPQPTNHYAMSKWAMEVMARNYLQALPVVVARPFNYTGPGQATEFVIPKLVQHFAQRAAHICLGNVYVEREFNDVRMVCNAYLQLLLHGTAGQTYNLCTGQPYGLQNVIDALAELSGQRLRVEVDPALVRAHEVHRLCGSPAKLKSLFVQHGVPWVDYALADTLRDMLAAHVSMRIRV